MSTWPPVVTGIGGVVVASPGLFLAGLRQRRESLDQRVERVVKSQVGDRFFDFLEIGERTEKECLERNERARGQNEALLTQAQERLNEPDRGQSILKELTSVLTRAEDFLPKR
ncbi:MAG: hypothetical protein ACLP36_07445 [Acidimicrobiales bacterium]